MGNLPKKRKTKDRERCYVCSRLVDISARGWIRKHVNPGGVNCIGSHSGPVRQMYGGPIREDCIGG